MVFVIDVAARGKIIANSPTQCVLSIIHYVNSHQPLEPWLNFDGAVKSPDLANSSLLTH